MEKNADLAVVIGGVLTSVLIICSTAFMVGSSEVTPVPVTPVPVHYPQNAPSTYIPGTYVNQPISRREVERAVQQWVDHEKMKRNPVRFMAEKMWEY